MSRALQLAVVCLSVALAGHAASPGAEEVEDLKPEAKIVMDHGPLAYKLQLQLVIRSAEELVASSSKPLKSKDREVQREMSLALAKLFKVDAIDWDKQMVIGIMTGGGRGDAGNLAFKSFQIEGKSLTVHYKGPGYPDHTCASNSGLALVDRFDGVVQFVDANAPNVGKDSRPHIRRQEDAKEATAATASGSGSLPRGPGKDRSCTTWTPLETGLTSGPNGAGFGS